MRTFPYDVVFMGESSPHRFHDCRFPMQLEVHCTARDHAHQRVQTFAIPGNCSLVHSDCSLVLSSAERRTAGFQS